MDHEIGPTPTNCSIVTGPPCPTMMCKKWCAAAIAQAERLKHIKLDVELIGEC